MTYFSIHKRDHAVISQFCYTKNAIHPRDSETPFFHLESSLVIILPTTHLEIFLAGASFAGTHLYMDK